MVHRPKESKISIHKYIVVYYIHIFMIYYIFFPNCVKTCLKLNTEKPACCSEPMKYTDVVHLHTLPLLYTRKLHPLVSYEPHPLPHAYMDVHDMSATHCLRPLHFHLIPLSHFYWPIHPPTPAFPCPTPTSTAPPTWTLLYLIEMKVNSWL